MEQRLKGIDVSHHNGPLDWDKVKAAGIQFAYVKATEGPGYTDPQFARNRAEAHRVGIRVGFYHFMHVEGQAADQAAHFLDVIGHLGPNEMAPSLDVETITTGTDWVKVDRSIRVAKVQHWLDTIDPVSEGAGLGKCLVYCSPGWWRSVFGSAQFGAHPLWAARYSANEPDLRGTCWKDWEIWQHDDQGHLLGLGGGFDLNLMKVRA